MLGRAYIYTGADLTGSEALLDWLAQERGAIESQGYGLALPPDTKDDGRGGHLPWPQAHWSRMRGYRVRARADVWAQAPDAAAPLILGDDTMLGRVDHLVEGKFFPRPERRIRVIRFALAGRPVARLVIGIRDYAGLFVAAWRKRAETALVPPFGVLSDQMAASTRGWPDVVATAQRLLRPEETVIIDQSRPHPARSLLQTLVPRLDPSALDDPHQPPVRVGDHTLSVLQEVYAKGAPLRPRARDHLIAAHSARNGTLGLAQFQALQAGRLAQKFAQDLQTLRAMPGVRLIDIASDASLGDPGAELDPARV